MAPKRKTNELLQTYIKNNIELATALAYKKQQFSELEDELRFLKWEILVLKHQKRENDVLKLQLEDKNGEMEKLQATVAELKRKVVNWRTLFSELMTFNTAKFTEAIRMLGFMPNQNNPKQSASLTHQSTEHTTDKPSQENQVKEDRTMNITTKEQQSSNVSAEIKPTEIKTKAEDETKPEIEIKANDEGEFEVKDEGEAKNEGQAEAGSKAEASDITVMLSSEISTETSTTEDMINYIEDTLKPSTLYPIIGVVSRSNEAEFSEDSMGGLAVPMSHVSPGARSFEVSQSQSGSYQESGQLKSASFGMNSSPGVDLFPPTFDGKSPRVTLTKCMDVENLMVKPKPDVRFLHASNITTQRKRLSTNSLALESYRSNFYVKSPRLSNCCDLNTSFTTHTLSLSNGLNTSRLSEGISQSLDRISESTPSKTHKTPVLPTKQSNSRRRIKEVPIEDTPRSQKMQYTPTPKPNSSHKTPSKIPRSTGYLISKNAQGDEDERSPSNNQILDKSPTKSLSFGSKKNSNKSIGNDIHSPKTPLTSPVVPMSAAGNTNQINVKKLSKKRPLQTTNDAHMPKRHLMDSDADTDKDNDNIPIAYRRPRRRAAPRDLREPLLKDKMRRK